ncbi:MAG: 7-carboxy-7-deazaguanine synthase QueE [Spirulinaceae cyanobacterium]
MIKQSTSKANLVEVFSAIQGEGINVGTRQIFIRFAFCDLRCHFCDSSHTWGLSPQCRVEQTPGKRDFLDYPNLVELPMLLQWFKQQDVPGLHDSISLTGGEPLLHAPFLQKFLPQLKEVSPLPIYLETGGHRPQLLSKVLPYLDLVGMDIKLPSTSGEEHWQAHGEFLQLCRNASVDVFVKIIVSQTTNPDELKQAAELVAKVNPEIVIFLQPVTPLEKPLTDKQLLSPTPDQILDWQVLMKHLGQSQKLNRVKVLPQTHKMIGQL